MFNSHFLFICRRKSFKLKIDLRRKCFPAVKYLLKLKPQVKNFKHFPAKYRSVKTGVESWVN